MNTEITTQTIEASFLRVPTNPTFPFFATVRLRKDTNIVLDGRIYKSEASMRKNRAGRPKSAVMLKITERMQSQWGGRYYAAEIVDV
jgi:hypothetical protein